MEIHVNREIHLIEGSEHKNLYSWSLQEYSLDGKKEGSAQIPWAWSLNFVASELRYNKKIKLENDRRDENYSTDKITESTESVSANLHSGGFRGGKGLSDVTSFSMFGTDREIKNFNLLILQLEAKDINERCRIWGSVSFTSEIDFRNETQADDITVEIYLTPLRFKEIVEAVKTQNVDVLVLRISHAMGFYSEWSPSISTRSVKVLTQDNTHKVITAHGSTIAILRLGAVGECDLNLYKRTHLNLNQDFQRADTRMFEEEEYGTEETQKQQKTGSVEILTQLIRTQQTLRALRFPIWAIVIMLGLMLLKR